MRLLVTIPVIFLLCTCSIIPDDAGQDIPTQSIISQIDYSSGTSNALGNYTISGNSTVIEWVEINGVGHGIDPTFPEPTFTVIEEEGTRIALIKHTAMDGSELMSFRFVYDLSKLDTIYVETPTYSIVDVFHYAITGILDSVSRTTEFRGSDPLEIQKGILIPESNGYILVNPYDPSEPGPGEGAFDNPGSVNWVNAFFSNGNSGADNGNIVIQQGIDPGDQEQYASLLYTNERDAFTNAVSSYEIIKEHFDSDGNSIIIDNYINPFFLKPNNFFASNSHILYVLYGNLIEGGAIVYPGAPITSKYNFIQSYE